MFGVVLRQPLTFHNPGGDPIEAYNICLWLGGTQSIDNTSSATYNIPYANIDRIAFGMVGIFGSVVFPFYDSVAGTEEVLSFTENFISFPLDFAPVVGLLPAYALQGGIAGASTFNTRATQVIQMNWTGDRYYLHRCGRTSENCAKRFNPKFNESLC